jgi:diacylglycerol O-acyltransferase / wax synthase
MQQLSQQDAMFLYSETPRMPMHLSSIHLYDPSTAPEEITFDRMVEHVRSRLPLARILRRKVVHVPLDLDYPYWVEDEDFDLEFHVRNIALPPPGSWRQLWVQAARLHSQPLDLTRPPWELYIIDGVEDAADLGPGSFGMMIKVHHSAIDGISGIELMNALHDLSPGGRASVDDSWRSEPDPSAFTLLARAGANVASIPARAWQLMSNAMPKLPAMQSQTLRAGLAPTLPKTYLNGPVTTHRVGDGFRFDLSTAKQLRASVPGATVNDVVLAVVGGGLRRYLRSKGELPAAPLYAGVPISMRTEEEAGTAGNKISIMIVSLATDIEEPIARLTAVQRSTSQSKEQATAVAARTLAEGAELFPGALLGAAVRALPQLGAGGVTSMTGNVCVTNVPGSQVPLYLCGARMESYYGLGPVFDHAGPIHLVVSYLGKVHLSVTTCREIMPDIEFYIECLEQSLADLVEATQPARPAKTPRPRASATTAKATKKPTKRPGVGGKR